MRTMLEILERFGGPAASPDDVHAAWLIVARDLGEDAADKQLGELNRRRGVVGMDPVNKPWWRR